MAPAGRRPDVRHRGQPEGRRGVAREGHRSGVRQRRVVRAARDGEPARGDVAVRRRAERVRGRPDRRAGAQAEPSPEDHRARPFRRRGRLPSATRRGRHRHGRARDRACDVRSRLCVETGGKLDIELVCRARRAPRRTNGGPARMPHHTPLIGMIVAGIVLAFVLGALANRLRVSPLMGYLLAGVLVGPYTPGYVADQALADQLAEIGVILLMFGVGMHFSLKDLLSVKGIAVPGAIVKIAIATLLGLGLALALEWTVGAGIVFGLALSCASTVVLLRAMQERHLIETERGRIAVGWLIVEDLAMVLALVLLPALGGLLRDGADTSAPNMQQIATTFA